jgi:putative transposase
VREKNNLWEIRHDPYDVSRVFLRGPDGWITVFWKHLDRAPVPFGELAWDHARQVLAERGSAPATEALRRRVREQEMELAFLKKAAAYFAREPR